MGSIGLPGGGQFDQVGDEQVGRNKEVQEQACNDVGAAIVVAGETYEDAVLFMLVRRRQRDDRGVYLLQVHDHQAQVGDDEHQDHEIPEAKEAGALFGIMAEAGSACQRMCGKYMAIFGIASESGGVGVGVGGSGAIDGGCGGFLSAVDGSESGVGARGEVNGRRRGHFSDCRHGRRERKASEGDIT
jgi:hypothetical protein